MKVFTSFNLLLSFIALLMLLATTSSHAEKGMNVPAIGSMVVMSGLENPWDVAFTPDGSMFYTEKCKGLSIKTSSGSTNALYGMKGSKVIKMLGMIFFVRVRLVCWVLN